MITQQAVRNRLAWMWKAYPFAGDDVMVLQKSLSLVASSWECLGGLLKGIPTVIADYESVRDPGLFAAACSEHHVTRLYGSPALFAGVLDQREKKPSAFTSLRLAFTSAEPISPSMVKRWRKTFNGVPLYNLYGSSECSSNTMQYDCADLKDSDVRVPLGKPLPNINTFVLDATLQPVPKGVIGELCISGTCLARGYLNDPGETSARFLQVNRPPFGLATLYRTGDLVRIRQDNQMEFLGRNDFQINIRGFRIEPAEIENVLLTIPSIEECIVRVEQQETEPQRLVAFVGGETQSGESTIRRTLRSLLPDYMVPEIFVFLEKLPRGASGKIDPNALKIPEAAIPDPPSETITDPSSLQSSLTLLWQRLLGSQELGLDDNFFDAGGHSLLAAKLFSEIHSITGKSFPVSALYRAPTLRSLVQLLQEDGLQKLWNSLVPIRQPGGKPPLFCITPLSESAICFRCFPLYLDREQPIYSLESGSGPESNSHFNSLDEMIGQYLDEIQSFYPEGPLYLCGFSGGGVVAWELAIRLKAAGREVRNLVLFDTSLPGHSTDPARGDKRKLVKLKRLLKTTRQQPGWRKMGYLIETAIMKISWKLNRRKEEDIRTLEYEERVMEAKRYFFKDYRSQPYAGKVTLFRARQRRLETLADPSLGWSNFAVDGLELCEVPGRHNTMLLDPHGKILCHKLQQYLDRSAT